MINKYSFRRIIVSVIPLALFFLLAAGALFQNTKKDTSKVNLELKEDKKSAEVNEKESSGPADTVRIGAYIFSIYDLDFPGCKLDIDFYLWYNVTRDSIDMLEYLEVINATEYNKSGETKEKRGKNLYQTVRINSTIKEEWDVSHFPFDRQLIEIYIEDYDKDNSKLVLVPDTIASKIDKNVHVDGWVIKDFGIKVLDHVYETNYGDPNIPLNEYSAYSRAVIYFTLEREGKGLFFKLFVGLFISVLISLLTFFINPMDLDPRFGLSVGAIFAAIASQYVITSSLPQNESLTLVDILHDISFIFIFLCILVSTISLNYMKNGKEMQSQKLDRYSLYILAGMYLALISYFILNAVN